MTDIREKMKDLLLADLMASARANETIRETLTAKLVAKAGDMSPEELVAVVQKLQSSDSLVRYQNIIEIFDSLK